MDSSSLYRKLRKILPWIITALLLAAVLAKVGVRDVVSQLNGANVRNVAILSLTLYTFIYFANSLSYYIVFRSMGYDLPYGEVLSIRGATYLLTAISPGVGQGGMAFWISRKKKIPLKEVISMFLMLPVVDMVFLAIVLSALLVVQHLSGGLIDELYADILTVVVFLLWTLLALHFVYWKAPFARGLFKGLRNSPLLKAYREASLKNYLELWVVRVIMDIAGLLAFYFGLALFKVTIPFWVFTVRFFPAIIIQALPVTVGQFGTSQGAWILMYSDFADPSALTAFTLIWVSVYNISRLVIGAICFRGEARYYFMKEREVDSVKEALEEDVVTEAGHDER